MQDDEAYEKAINRGLNKSITIHDELTINLRDLTEAMNTCRDDDGYCKSIDVWKKLLEWSKK